MSATRRRTAARIVRSAQDLTEERGLDGFTMDEVAAAAGVSRRTLFNYVDGKLDAVLGAPPTPNPARLDEFRAGGPTGRLADDVRAVLTPVLQSKGVAPEDWQRLRRLIASEARLHKAMHDKFAVVAGYFTDAILEREDGFDELRARAAATVILALFDLALDAYVEDPTSSFAACYLAAFDGAEALFD
ncbi:TetR family transcriptional regulator [Nocardioides sp. BGMRC 2183]|nr:TetR family transcriptional regulator [Nocardioides sp. BGMRC 2183]